MVKLCQRIDSLLGRNGFVQFGAVLCWYTIFFYVCTQEMVAPDFSNKFIHQTTPPTNERALYDKIITTAFIDTPDRIQNEEVETRKEEEVGGKQSSPATCSSGVWFCAGCVEHVWIC